MLQSFRYARAYPPDSGVVNDWLPARNRDARSAWLEPHSWLLGLKLVKPILRCSAQMSSCTLPRLAAQGNCNIRSRWISIATMAVFVAEALASLKFFLLELGKLHNIVNKLVNSL